MCKFGRKFTSALLALALFVSLLPIGAAPAQAEGLTIEINSGSDLLYFIRDLGSGNEGYADANVVLTANISVGDFFPIGYYAPQSPVVPFTGTFDGNGHTISGNLVGIDNENFPVNKVGIIAVLGSAGIVKNLNVTCSVSGRVDGNSAASWEESWGASALQTAPSLAASKAMTMSVALWVRTISGSGHRLYLLLRRPQSAKATSAALWEITAAALQTAPMTSISASAGAVTISAASWATTAAASQAAANNGRSGADDYPPSSASGNLGGVVGQRRSRR